MRLTIDVRVVPARERRESPPAGQLPKNRELPSSQVIRSGSKVTQHIAPMNLHNVEAAAVYTGANSGTGYQYLNGGMINHHLRDPTQHAEKRIDIRYVVRHLDDAIKKSKIKHDTVVHRGMTTQAAEMQGKKPGDVISFPHYLSTSRDPHVGGGYGTASKTHAHVHIHLKQGDPALEPASLLPHSRYKKNLTYAAPKAEGGRRPMAEVILGRHHKFRVERVNEVGHPTHLTSLGKSSKS